MFKTHNPATIAPPLSPTYVNAVETPAGGRWLHVSGQLAAEPSGQIPTDFPSQCNRVWTNIAEILASAGMTMADIVKMTAFLVPGQDLAQYGQIRAKHLQGHRPASTMVVVAALARPEFLVEVEVIAWAP